MESARYAFGLLFAFLATACGADVKHEADSPAPSVDVVDIVLLDVPMDFSPGETADSFTEIVAPPPELQLLAPPFVLLDHPFPVVLRVPAGDHVDVFASGEATLFIDSPDISFPDLTVRRGVASATLLPVIDGEHILVAGGLGQGDRPIEFGVHKCGQELTGTLEGEHLLWSSCVHLIGDVVVPIGKTLTVEPGTMVMLEHKVNIYVLGEVHCMGDEMAPIWFTSYTDLPWGGVIHEESAGSYAFTFFTNGGGDSKHNFGHSSSQPVLFVRDGEMTLDNVFLLDNPGKALGAKNSEVTVTRSLISRCDTGGEFEHTRLSMADCHVLEIPNADDETQDDDNDGIYLLGVHDEVPADSAGSTIVRSVFAVGKDDGIDHNGAALMVEDCFIEQFHHEGIACSNKNWAHIANTLVRGCGQGIEAGYGSPEVVIDHCTLTENSVGIRLGDSYEDEVSGTITMTNSIAVLNSAHNVWNFSRQDNGPLADHVSINFSMVDSPQWDDKENNIGGVPLFQPDYTLAPGSPGLLAGADGSDVGYSVWVLED
jgi:hypothetical protein